MQLPNAFSPMAIAQLLCLDLQHMLIALDFSLLYKQSSHFLKISEHFSFLYSFGGVSGSCYIPDGFLMQEIVWRMCQLCRAMGAVHSSVGKDWCREEVGREVSKEHGG